MRVVNHTNWTRRLSNIDGVWIRRARELLDLSQAELGALVGVSKTCIYCYETGRRHPSRRVAEELLGILLERLMVIQVRLALIYCSPMGDITLYPCSQGGPGEAFGAWAQTRESLNLLSDLWGADLPVPAAWQ